MLIDFSLLDEAYERIRVDARNHGCSVLIFVSPEPDSLCACKILTSLLQTDKISHKIKPASGYEDLARFNGELIVNNEEIRSLILINCGGIVDLLDFFSLPPHTNVYVLDSHRPYHLANVRLANEQVCMLDDGDGTMDAYPDDVSEEELSPEEEEDEDEEEVLGQAGGPKIKKRKTEAELQKRQEKRDALRKITEYYRGSYYGKSAALLMYELAKQLNQSSNDLLWFAIVGVADQFVNERISREQYTLRVSDFHEEVVKFNPGADSEEKDKLSQPEGTQAEINLQNSPGYISFGYEYRMMLLRHWSLYASMFHSRYVASTLSIWEEGGRQRLKHFLAAIGLPLEECMAPFNQMGEEYKALLKLRIDEKILMKAYGLQDITFGSFAKQHGTTMRIAATDYVYAMAALLEELPSKGFTKDGEEEDADRRWETNFWNAYNALTSSEKDIATLKRGLNNCIALQEAVVRQGSSMIGKKVIVPTGSFRYAVMEDSADLEIFSHPLALTKLLLFLADSVDKKKTDKPFVLCCYVEKRNTYLCVGGLNQNRTGARPGLYKNVFGVAFRDAADRTNARIKHDGFETAMMEVQKDDLKHFLEVLHSGLIDL
jgi:cell division control protein 45